MFQYHITVRSSLILYYDLILFLPIGFLPVGFPQHILQLFSYSCCMSCPSYPSRLDHKNGFWWRVSLMNLFIIQFFFTFILCSNVISAPYFPIHCTCFLLLGSKARFQTCRQNIVININIPCLISLETLQPVANSKFSTFLLPILSSSYYTGRLIIYSGITKIYYRKTLGHVFTKPVQIKGTTQSPPVICFSS
jgi:hypothetical protein